MYHKAQILAFGGIAFFSSAFASPIDSQVTAVSCNDVTTGLDPSCWAKLNMTGWFHQWGKSTPGAQGGASIETPSDSDLAATATLSSPSGFQTGGDLGFRRRSQGCEPNEPWSTCFLRLGLGKTGQDCSKLGGQTCVAPKAGQPPHTPQIFYGVWSIYGESLQTRAIDSQIQSNTFVAVNEYITSVYSALQTLLSTKPDAIRSAATYAPGAIPYSFPAKTPVLVDGVLIQILLKQTNNKELPDSLNTPLVSYLQQYTSKRTYDENTPVDQLTRGMQESLVNALGMIMGDLPTFEKFVENGAFSTTELPQVNELVSAFAA